jgi:hypothetical protein
MADHRHRVACAARNATRAARGREDRVWGRVGDAQAGTRGRQSAGASQNHACGRTRSASRARARTRPRVAAGPATAAVHDAAAAAAVVVALHAALHGGMRAGHHRSLGRAKVDVQDLVARV